MALKSLSKAKFKAWLESKHPRTRVGVPNECWSCPIAKFLRQTTEEEWEVDRELVFSIETCRSHSLPKWAGNFIDKIDMIETKTVSAVKCLQILRSC